MTVTTTYDVLLVDDDPNILSGLERALRGQGFRVRKATCGRDALDALSEQPADAIVSDQSMPSMKGIDLLGLTANLYPTMVRFMLTGEATLDVALQAINSGQVQRFLVKPCHGVELALALREQLQKRALIQGASRLLTEAKRQRSVLDTLERSNPGITHVERDGGGAIVLDDAEDCQRLVDEIQLLLGANPVTGQDAKGR